MRHRSASGNPLRSSLAVVLTLCSAGAVRAQASQPPIEERTPPTHPIHYFVSPPAGWNRHARWPVVVVIPDAYREFEATARRFVQARGSRPFIIVVPLVLSGGGTARQHMTDFDYTPAVWARADRAGSCRFDDDGLTAVLLDVRQRYNGEDRVFITGWEAGGHVMLAQLFEHPERFRGVVAATPNFQARCMTSNRRVPPSVSAIPIRGFHGADDASWAPGQPLFAQWPRVDSVARARGFTNVADTVIPGQGRGPMPASVLDFFAALIGR